VERRRILLVGCVAGNRDEPAPARELYISRLFRTRRAYAELKGCDWFIVSAKHALLDPEAWTRPYDLALSQLTPAEREAWAALVRGQLCLRYGQLTGTTFELHAGAVYVKALRPLLEQDGATVETPLAGLGIGQQLAWYNRRLRP
jgi:hypothetical protein